MLMWKTPNWEWSNTREKTKMSSSGIKQSLYVSLSHFFPSTFIFYLVVTFIQSDYALKHWGLTILPQGHSDYQAIWIFDYPIGRHLHDSLPRNPTFSDLKEKNQPHNFEIHLKSTEKCCVRTFQAIANFLNESSPSCGSLLSNSFNIWVQKWVFFTHYCWGCTHFRVLGVNKCRRVHYYLFRSQCTVHLLFPNICSQTREQEELEELLLLEQQSNEQRRLEVLQEEQRQLQAKRKSKQALLDELVRNR